MSIIKKGQMSQGAIHIQPGASGGFNDDGLFSWRETRRCDIAFAAQYTPAYNSPHPEFPDLVLKSLTTIRLPLDVYEISGVWRGVILGGSSGDRLPVPIESIQTSSGEEPIETNARFAEFAGELGDEKNGAVFDEETGLFIGFAASAPERFRGARSYLAPALIFSRISYQRAVPENALQLNKIDNPGGAYAQAQLTGDQNYLKISADSDQFGEIYQLRESWLRSGPNGWNAEFYT